MADPSRNPLFAPKDPAQVRHKSALSLPERSQPGVTFTDKGSQSPRSFVVGTAGHIDHGKTALVLALTGVAGDRLPEEKARGITIDLGFAALDLTGTRGQRLEVSLIDVPGHHAFVRNMLAGAGGIDAVVLVVAADEGVKAQTREHLQICRLLGIQHGLIVLTKTDLVSAERLDTVRDDAARLVEGTFLQGAPTLGVSARTRQGVEPLKSALAQLLSALPRRLEGQVPRLPVDRVFSVKGFGTVITGTLQAGSVHVGASQVLLPRGREVRVRGVQVHGTSRAEAGAPNRVALNVTGLEVSDVHRGDTLVPPRTLEPVHTLDAEIETLPGTPALRHRQRLRVHAFASESLATVLFYPPASSDDQDGHQLVRLRLTRPMVLVTGDRFVLRLPSPAMTLGGGRVLDAHPRERLSKNNTPRWLRSLRNVDRSTEILLRVRRTGVRSLPLQQLIAETGLTAEALRVLVDAHIGSGALIIDPGSGSYLTAEALTEAQDQLFREVSSAKDLGVTRPELRSRLNLNEWVFARAALGLISDRRLALYGDRLRLPVPGQDPGNAERADKRLMQVEQFYRTAGLASPLVGEAGERLRIESTELRSVLTSLLRSGALVRLGSDTLLIHRDPLGKLITQLQQQHKGQSFDIGRFKSFTALTRKHAIPLLEYLDGARVTRNTAGVRVVL